MASMLSARIISHRVLDRCAHVEELRFGASVSAPLFKAFAMRTTIPCFPVTPDGVRNPIVSTIVYLSEGSGGPTLMTTQHIADKTLAARGWLAFPKLNRLVAFDAEYLHGVIPGRSADQVTGNVFLLSTECGVRYLECSRPCVCHQCE